jgi:hypothetical protein
MSQNSNIEEYPKSILEDIIFEDSGAFKIKDM